MSDPKAPLFPPPRPEPESFSRSENRRRDFPGSTCGNAIPPTDTAEYRRLQRLYGLRPDEYLGSMTWPRKTER